MKPFSGNLIIVLAAGFVLGGCGADMDDLDQYINEIKARPGGRIEPLPEITPYEVFSYTADKRGFRSPFVPDSPQVSGGPDSGTGPIPSVVANSSRVFRSTPCAWLARWNSERPTTG